MAIAYRTRHADAVLSELFSQLPALMVLGPRAAGKTTTARNHASTVVRLDRAAEAAAFVSDPDAALRSFAEPLLLDEWQAVPGVLGAVKRAVDTDRRPGRFLLTGSVRAQLTADTWPGTGRVVPIHMYPLTQREVAGQPSGPDFLDLAALGDAGAFALPTPLPDLPEYLRLAVIGGYPPAVLSTSQRAREVWADGYLTQLLERDAVAVEDRDPGKLRRYFEALALNSAGLPQDRTLYEAAGIDRKTALAYERLLTNLHVLDLVPPWLPHRMSRLVKSSKRYLIDASMIAAALRLDHSAILRDGDLMGRVLDTFVAAQLRPELALSARRPRLHHFREANGRREIDALIELGGGTVVAVEVKATSAPRADDARHLSWLRTQLGDRFLAGVVLHTGPTAFRLAPDVVAVPIAALWGPRS